MDVGAMKIVVIGGTGLIGERVVNRLTRRGHEVVAASRRTGVNSYTAEGLAEALEGAEVLVDASNSSYVDLAGVREFFYVSTLNLLTYGAAAGIRHHVTLSVVGTDRLARTESGYFDGKDAQETLIKDSGHAYSMVHSTQFFEYLGSIADSATQGNTVRLAHAFVQPIAADDVGEAIAEVAAGEPLGGTREIAGPEKFRLEDFVRQQFALHDDPRQVMADPLGRYLGSKLEERDLLPGADVTVYPTRFGDWLAAGGPARG
jgi:uncharacterized protein YbjT (DUF2867 family)